MMRNSAGLVVFILMIGLALVAAQRRPHDRVMKEIGATVRQHEKESGL